MIGKMDAFAAADNAAAAAAAAAAADNADDAENKPSNITPI